MDEDLKKEPAMSLPGTPPFAPSNWLCWIGVSAQTIARWRIYFHRRVLKSSIAASSQLTRRRMPLRWQNECLASVYAKSK